MIVAPMETTTESEFKRAVRVGLEKGWIRLPDPATTLEAMERANHRAVMRRQRSKAPHCVEHQPNLNGFCIVCGRKVNSIHADEY